jgi:MFS family permease
VTSNDETVGPIKQATGSLQASNAWRLLGLLFLANTFNFYDRAIPSIIAEPLKLEFDLSDLDLGLLTGAFTVVYALCGIPLGRLADRAPRGRIMGYGLAVWSLLTAATGAAWNYTSLLLARLGVGIGEASYAPAANSMIADLFPANKRARAFGVFQLGLPVGLILAFFTVGAIVDAFDSWRAPLFLAAIPGLILAVLLFTMREPLRGASEATQVNLEPVDHPFRRILRVPTMWALIVAGIGANIAAYAVNSFAVPYFMRYFGLSLTTSAMLVGVVVGISGLIGLLAGGWLADKADGHSVQARVMLGAVGTLVAAALSFVALRAGADAVAFFVIVFSIGWTLQYLYYTSAYPAVADVIEPRMRATAVAVFFAAFYLLGGATGPVIVGALSDHFAAEFLATTPGATRAAANAIGLHDSLLAIVPVALVVASIGLFVATRTVCRDNARMKEQLTAA